MKKRDANGNVPAIERYDGPAFRVLRRYLRNNRHSDLTVHILSAKFGFVKSDRRIPNYDMRLTRDRSVELQDTTRHQLEQIMHEKPWDQIGISLSREYFALVADGIREANVLGTIASLDGGLGKRLTALKAWLESRA